MELNGPFLLRNCGQDGARAWKREKVVILNCGVGGMGRSSLSPPLCSRSDLCPQPVPVLHHQALHPPSLGL